MRRRPIIVIIGSVVATLVLAALFIFSSEGEPSYQGKTLSQWAEIFWGGRPIQVPRALANPRNALTPSQEQARTAIRAIGTNALPTMLKWIANDLPRWKRKIAAASGRLPGPIGRYFQSNSNRHPVFGKEQRQKYYAAACFEALGQGAAPAVPKLEQIMNHPGRLPQAHAMIALSLIGTEGLPPLLKRLMSQSNSEMDRSWACFCLRWMGTNAAAAVPALARCLQDQDKTFAGAAAQTLGALALDPDVSVPALIEALAVPGFDPAFSAALALADFGDRARAAVPILLTKLADPDPSVSAAAVAALESIAPKELEKALGENPRTEAQKP